MPFFLYVGTADPGWDYVVDDKYSAEQYAEDLDEVGLAHDEVFVPGAVHSWPWEAHDEYVETIGAVKMDMVNEIVKSQSFYEFMNVQLPVRLLNR